MAWSSLTTLLLCYFVLEGWENILFELASDFQPVIVRLFIRKVY